MPLYKNYKEYLKNKNICAVLSDANRQSQFNIRNYYNTKEYQEWLTCFKRYSYMQNILLISYNDFLNHILHEEFYISLQQGQEDIEITYRIQNIEDNIEILITRTNIAWEDITNAHILQIESIIESHILSFEHDIYNNTLASRNIKFTFTHTPGSHAIRFMLYSANLVFSDTGPEAETECNPDTGCDLESETVLDCSTLHHELKFLPNFTYNNDVSNNHINIIESCTDISVNYNDNIYIENSTCNITYPNNTNRSYIIPRVNPEITNYVTFIYRMSNVNINFTDLSLNGEIIQPTNMANIMSNVNLIVRPTENYKILILYGPLDPGPLDL